MGSEMCIRDRTRTWAPSTVPSAPVPVESTPPQSPSMSGVIAKQASTFGLLRSISAGESGLPVIASGGISQVEDVRGLMQHASAGICGAITGRAIYEGTLDLAAAQAMVDAYLEGA